jgi:hypothetical protein
VSDCLGARTESEARTAPGQLGAAKTTLLLLDHSLSVVDFPRYKTGARLQFFFVLEKNIDEEGMVSHYLAGNPFSVGAHYGVSRCRPENRAMGVRCLH